MKRIVGRPVNGQGGVALILSLLLLFVMLILGVAGFNNTHVQERSAGNARLAAVAFEAAAAGANNGINFFDSHHDLGPDELCGATGHEGWEAPTEWVDMGSFGEATLRQRLYCLADEYPCAVGETGCTTTDRPARSQLFVLSRGEVTIDNKVVAQRDVEVRLEVGHNIAWGHGCGAICLPACPTGTLEFPNSNAFQVDGNGGPAITTGCQSAATNVLSAIRDNRIGNYIGGIDTITPGSPWDSPDSVELFRQDLLASALAAELAGTCQSTCFSPGPLIDNGNTSYGSPGDSQITYIEGDASFGGGISGAGILVVNGNLAWTGTPNFEGLILVLGGTFTLVGGGTGGDHSGSIVVLNTVDGSSTEFGPASFDTTGGGIADFTFSCEALWSSYDLLDEAGQDMWSPECDVGPQTPYQAGPDQLVIASWRENIGWREGFFGAD